MRGCWSVILLSFVLMCRSLILSVCSQNVAPSICKISLGSYLKWFPRRSQRDVCPKVSGSIPASSSQNIWMGFCYLKLCGFDRCFLSTSTRDRSEKSSLIGSWGHCQVQEGEFQDILNLGRLNLHRPINKVENSRKLS